LKKQSQFAEWQNDVKSIITMVYGDFDERRQRKNKANSKPNKANRRPMAGNSKHEALNPKRF
jgi:hypothetical protein